MNRDNLKNAIIRRKFSIIIIIVLLIMSCFLFVENQNYKFILLYQYKIIPDIELINTLSESQSGLTGEVRGFVKFDDITNQPNDVRQYYIIKSQNKFNEQLQQYFSLEELIKLKNISLRSLGTSELIEVNQTDKTVILEDENGNQFFIDKFTKEVSMRDSTGDNISLVTSDNAYGDFIKVWLK